MAHDREEIALPFLDDRVAVLIAVQELLEGVAQEEPLLPLQRLLANVHLASDEVLLEASHVRAVAHHVRRRQNRPGATLAVRLPEQSPHVPLARDRVTPVDCQERPVLPRRVWKEAVRARLRLFRSHHALHLGRARRVAARDEEVPVIAVRLLNGSCSHHPLQKSIIACAPQWIPITVVPRRHPIQHAPRGATWSCETVFMGTPLGLLLQEREWSLLRTACHKHEEDRSHE